MTTLCRECGAEIQESTATRSGGKCMPCSYRRHTRLGPEAQKDFDTFVEKLNQTGWEQSLPNRRRWLDLVERLKAAIRRNPDTAYQALGDGELTTTQCTSPSECCLTVGKLRRLAAGLFEAEAVRESCEDVSFRLGTRTWTVDFVRPASARRDHLLAVCNDALAAIETPRRFVLLPSARGPRPVTFIDPQCVERAKQLGLIPNTRE